MTATVVSALAPIRESFRVDLVTAIKGREGAVTMRSRTTSALIVVQLAMSFVLLTAAVLFARLPGRITNIDPGFETRQTMMVPLEVDIPPYTKASALTFYRTLESRILAVPGVQSLSYASIAPFDSAQQDEIRLADQKKGQGRAAATDNVSEDFFSTFGIPLLRGRAFTGSDVSADASAPVAVVSQAFARAFWGEGNALGRVVVTPDDRRLTVIGVVRDTRSEHFGMFDGPRLYTLRDPGSLRGQLFVRFRGDAGGMSTAIGKIVRALDSSQVETPSTIRDFMETNATQMRTLAGIILFMAGIAVVLAVTGVYAVLSFTISRRKREFGIQIMLGATREAIFRSVMTRGLRQIAIGLLCGAALALPAAWIFSGITKRSTIPIRAFDISVYAISALILLAISLCAMGLPAFRATQVDPIEALRSE